MNWRKQLQTTTHGVVDYDDLDEKNTSHYYFSSLFLQP